MRCPAAGFSFQAPPAVARARRVLVKPYAPYAVPYPATTSRQTLAQVVEGIRRISDADIIILEANPEGKAMKPIYQALGYDFPRVLTLDVRDSLWIEIDNPLTRPFALAAFWVSNVMLSCDFWISVAPLVVRHGIPAFTIHNLLGLLPVRKHSPPELESLGLNKVMADLYFALPFDLGLIEARQKLTTGEDPRQGQQEEFGQVFVGEPFEVDLEAAQACGLKPDFLELIKKGREELGW